MIRIDHITDPVRFAVSMAVAGAVASPSDLFLALLALAPLLVQRVLEGGAAQDEVRATPATGPARPEPTPA